MTENKYSKPVKLLKFLLFVIVLLFSIWFSFYAIENPKNAGILFILVIFALATVHLFFKYKKKQLDIDVEKLKQEYFEKKELDKLFDEHENKMGIK